VTEHARRAKGSRRAFRGRLSGIARFKAISRCRRRSEAPPEDDPAASIEKRERTDILQKCLATLTPIHRDVIALIYYQRRKIEEGAQLTGKPVSTVKTRLH
jgi:RNA polymerase sigma-70 factor (ECF subfamily)